MTLMARELKASFAFVERNFHLTKRYWGWEVAFLVYAVAGALAVSLIGRDQGNVRLLMTLVIGAVFWNYLSVVFSFIAETVAWERWEGTLEYTFMAPVRRYTQMLGSTLYAIAYGLVHTVVVLVVLALFFELDLSHANFADRGGIHGDRLGVASSASGSWPPSCRCMYVERGAQMTFVLQSVLLLVSGVYYSVEVLARLDAGHLQLLAGDLRPRRGAPRADRRRGDRFADRRRLATAGHGSRLHPPGPVGLLAARSATRSAPAS